MDTVGNRGAAIEISGIKVAVPRMATWVIDHAIQARGGGGVRRGFPLAELYAQAHVFRIADGPTRSTMPLARRELRWFTPSIPCPGP